MHVSTSHVWAEESTIERNLVRQLLIPAGELDVVEHADALRVVNAFGDWPAARSQADPDAAQLIALLPADAAGGQVQWTGDRGATSPTAILASYHQAIGFRPHGQPRSLRRPQIGALHAAMGYWASGLPEPGIVVMPTGTGKTETMLALLVAGRPERLLVLVPSTALRDQIAMKFETLGILQEKEIVSRAALRPCVGGLEHAFTDASEAARFAQACNVVVATPQPLHKFTPQVRAAFLSSFSHLTVGEAHHAPAVTWASVIDEFADRTVLLFTATPYREDGRPLPGRIIFRFPLREAQRDRHFTRIAYRAVLGLEDTDEELARLAVEKLRADLAAGYDHLLMARAKNIPRAEAITDVYRRLAPEFAPLAVHQNLGITRRRAAVHGLKERSCRIIVCVDMLGEGFDEPVLKIAAMHDAKKSLSPMIQFIGRFSRSAPGLGEATVFVAQEPSTGASPLRTLLREDADWNLLLRDITDRATADAEATSEFDASFSGAPEEVAVSVLEPKMSAVAHRAPSRQWRPEAALALFDGDKTVLDDSIAMGGPDSSVAWFVIERRSMVRWGAPQALEQVVYELIVLYFDKEHRILYIHGSEKSGTYNELAEAVLGEGSELLNGPQPYRVLAGLDRLIPTNVGLIDARDHFKRFSMHVGSDVSQGLGTSQEHKSQTHIATTGFDNGESVSISAASSGRFWSPSTADSLRAWTDWCDKQGAKLLDDSIDLKKIIDGFIIPEVLTERPPYVLLGVEWPWRVYTGSQTRLSVSYDGVQYSLPDVDFEVDDYSTTGDFLFSAVTDAWRVPYRAGFSKGIAYGPVGNDAVVTGSGPAPKPQPLQEWLSANKPDLFLEGDRLINEGRLLNPGYQRAPFDTALLTSLDWQGVDL